MLRNPNRIDKILERLRIIWKKNPDLRLSQLIENVFPHTIVGEDGCYDCVDPYYLECEDYISALEKFYSKPRIYRVGGKKDLKRILRNE